MIPLLEAIRSERNKYFDFYDISNEAYAPHRKFHELGKFAKERAFWAGNRLGKTTSGGIEGAQHATGTYIDGWNGYVFTHPINSWMVGVSHEFTRDLERRHFEGTSEEPPWIHPELVTYKNKSEHLYRIKHISGGESQIQFKTYEQRREKFQSSKLNWVHFDEEPPLDIYVEALTRTISTSPDHYGMVIITATPLQGVTPMILHYLNKKDSDDVLAPEVVIDSKAYVMAGWENAPHIPKEEQQRMIQTYAPHELEARTKGVPSLGSGMVYPVPESLVTCAPFEIPEFWPRVFSLDFGWEDPTAAIFAAHDTDNDTVYLYGEYSVNHLTPQHHANELIKQGANWMMGVYDPSGNAKNQKDGSKLADLYRQCGIPYLSKADNSREAGIQKVLQMFQNNKLYIFNTLHKTLREFRMYARKDGVPKDGNDHLMDCMRYLIMSGLPLARTKNHEKLMFGRPIHSYKNSQAPVYNGSGWMT